MPGSHQATCPARSRCSHCTMLTFLRAFRVHGLVPVDQCGVHASGEQPPALTEQLASSALAATCLMHSNARPSSTIATFVSRSGFVCKTGHWIAKTKSTRRGRGRERCSQQAVRKRLAFFSRRYFNFEFCSRKDFLLSSCGGAYTVSPNKVACSTYILWCYIASLAPQSNDIARWSASHPDSIAHFLVALTARW